MEIALSVRSKLDFVLGKQPKPTDPVLSAKWKRCNDVIMTWLLNSVSKKVVSHILHAKDVASAWRVLHNRYAGSNVSRKFYLKKDVSNIRQGDHDIANYFEKLNGFWKEIDAMSKRSGCEEDGDCNYCRTGAKERGEDMVIEFLMGLNEEYAHIRTHILALKELPSLDVVYGMALNAESQQIVARSPHVESSALYSSYQDKQGKNKGRMFCTHCQLHGHTKEYSYKLNGYPPGHKLYKGNPRTGGRGNGAGRAANVVTVEHTKKHSAFYSEQNKTCRSTQKYMIVLPCLSSNINQYTAMASDVANDVEKEADRIVRRIGDYPWFEVTEWWNKAKLNHERSLVFV
ncbi:hypothetical protein QQ045_010085 [Rhodiola kirilowii]